MSFVSSRLPISDDFASAVESLPVAPRILAALGPKLQLMDIPVGEVTQVVRRDAGLSARLITVANSSAYVGAETSQSVEDAVARIGFRETYRIIGAVASHQLSDAPLKYYALSPGRLRENALFVALVMEELAPGIEMDPRAAYAVGLLRSVGKVVLDRYAARIAVAEPFNPESTDLTAWETSMFGCTNVEVGAHVMRLWGFTEESAVSVRGHYAVSESSSLESNLLNLASGAAHTRGYGLPGEEPYWECTPRSLELAHTEESRLVRAADRARLALDRISFALA